MIDRSVSLSILSEVYVIWVRIRYEVKTDVWA